ncbi:hypothetical protein B0T24DRAFT_611068 [Lasiosphaeria ovina]|uniref:Uncharacterized protein n=1 Tax=Lasiosphaeria ovina TaxID=92902 RepID=A0AAE0KMJ7_9PEZI|nr:hypothetical protein B0T24DRAFT_611068 [Lasiosphaeria ovina]
MAGIPAPAGIEYWYSQVAMPMPPQGQQPAMISPPVVLPQSSVAPQHAMTREPLPNMPIAGTGNASSGQAARPSVLTLPVRPAPPEAPPGQLHCRWCEKCKRGLAYGTLSFICTARGARPGFAPAAARCIDGHTKSMCALSCGSGEPRGRPWPSPRHFALSAPDPRRCGPGFNANTALTPCACRVAATLSPSPSSSAPTNCGTGPRGRL